MASSLLCTKFCSPDAQFLGDLYGRWDGVSWDEPRLLDGIPESDTDPMSLLG